MTDNRCACNSADLDVALECPVHKEGLLSAAEFKALSLLAQVATLLREEIIAPGGTQHQDWHEACTHTHSLQHMIMAQAAVRAYPMEFRLLGKDYGEPAESGKLSPAGNQRTARRGASGQ